jgi:pyrimidine operon attenuation protein/uracil phosphoribosyltransferase
MKQIIEVSHSCLSDKVHNFIHILDALPIHTTVTKTKRQFDLVTFGIATTGLTLATYNADQILKLENKILANEKKLIDITNLHE